MMINQTSQLITELSVLPSKNDDRIMKSLHRKMSQLHALSNTVFYLSIFRPDRRQLRIALKQIFMHKAFATKGNIYVLQCKIF